MRTTIASLIALGLIAVQAGAAPLTQGPGREQRIAIQVTSRGFEPSTIRSRVGTPVVLVITRTTDKTCAKEFVIKERKVRQPLPLNRAVEIRLVPEKSGTLHFTCGMGMVSGTLVVQ